MSRKRRGSEIRTPWHENSAARIKRARLAQGLSQAEAARLIGRRQNFISKIEQGQRRLSAMDLAMLAVAYDVDPAELYGDPALLELPGASGASLSTEHAGDGRAPVVSESGSKRGRSDWLSVELGVASAALAHYARLARTQPVVLTRRSKSVALLLPFAGRSSALEAHRLVRRRLRALKG